MNVRPGDLGLAESARAPVIGRGKIDGAKRRSRAGLVRPPEAPAFQEQPLPMRPPRIGAGTREALQASSEQLLAARDEERQRIAVELHDSTSQHLAAMSLGLARLRLVSPEDGPGTAIINEIAKSLNEVAKQTRVLSYLMHPRNLARRGLSATVRQFLEGFAQRTGMEVALAAPVAVDRVPARLQHAALRIIQEALLNANRHAQARRVSVEISIDDTQFTVSIADDGRGMGSDQDGPCLGVGIPGMHARAREFSGDLTISSDESGTRVTARLPLA
jgi:two-component system, NarL family, sensor kinase